MHRLILIITVLVAFQSCGDSGSSNQQSEVTDTAIENDSPTSNDSKVSEEKIILFFGNSLSAGYGLAEGESFPDRIQEKIDANNLNYTVVNAGLSGETTAGGAARIDWVLKQDIDVFVLELGGNDLLRGINVQNTEDNLRSIMKKVQAKDESIKIVLAGMQAPPNMGADYANAFAGLYPELAKEFNAALIPFLLDKVGGVAEYNQNDGIHPNVEGAKIVAETVWATIKDIL